MFDRGMVHVVGGYIVYHYYLRLDRREDIITTNNMNHSSVKP
jgi:hypothetical protein